MIAALNGTSKNTDIKRPVIIVIIPSKIETIVIERSPLVKFFAADTGRIVKAPMSKVPTTFTPKAITHASITRNIRFNFFTGNHSLCASSPEKVT